VRRIQQITASALVASALGLLAASAAQASTVTTDPSGALVVSAGAERNDIGLQAPWEEGGRIVVYDGTGTPLTAATPACEQRETEAVVCAWSPAAKATTSCSPPGTGRRRRSTAGPATTSCRAAPAPTTCSRATATRAPTPT